MLRLTLTLSTRCLKKKRPTWAGSVVRCLP